MRIKVPGTEKTKVLDGTTTLYSKDSGGRGVEDMYMLMRLFSDTFDEELIETYISTKHKNNEDDELPDKKLKLNDNKKIAILEYSSV